MRRAVESRAPKRRRWPTVALGALFVTLLLGLGGYRRARAQLAEAMLDFGAEILRFDDADRQDLPRDLVVNGETLRLRTGRVPRTLTEVLDDVEARCAAIDGGLAAHAAALREANAGVRKAPPSVVLRGERPGAGFVSCLDLGSSVTLAELAARLERFGETGDVGAVGEVRYVYAEAGRTSAGEPSTHFAALWTRGAFRVGAMFPAGGDAPGRDPEGVPRAPGTRRMLDSFERGHPLGLTVYEAPGSGERMSRFYREALPDAGWQLPASDGPPPSGPDTVVAERDGETLVVVVAPRGSPSAPLVSVAVFHAR